MTGVNNLSTDISWWWSVYSYL